MRTPLAGFFNSLLVSLCLGASSCGTVGPPIPPESVGIKAKMLEEEKRVEREAKPDTPPEAITPVGETPVELPDLRPIGTR